MVVTDAIFCSVEQAMIACTVVTKMILYWERPVTISLMAVTTPIR